MLISFTDATEIGGEMEIYNWVLAIAMVVAVGGFFIGQMGNQFSLAALGVYGEILFTLTVFILMSPIRHLENYVDGLTFIGVWICTFVIGFFGGKTWPISSTN